LKDSSSAHSLAGGNEIRSSLPGRIVFFRH
jgi:hypothetical protein